MSQALSWSEIPNVEPAARIARASVDWRRWFGLKKAHAADEAACSLGLSPRRLRSLLHGEPVRVLRAEYRALLARWWSDMDRQAEALRRKADAIDRLAEAERIAELQLSLPLELPCFDPPSADCVFGAPGSRWRGDGLGRAAGGCGATTGFGVGRVDASDASRARSRKGGL